MRRADQRGPFERLADVAAARPRATVAAVVALALAGVVLALQLVPSASTDTLVAGSSPAAQATNRLKRQFGDDAIVVQVTGNLGRTVLTSDLARLLRLEGCLSGNVPGQALGQLPAPCRALARLKPAKVVYGPATFLNAAASEIQQGILTMRANAQASGDAAARSAVATARARGLSQAQQQQLANAARQLANQQFIQQGLKLVLRYGLQGAPSLDDPQFVNQVVFDTTSGIERPKPRFAFLFPSNEAALVLVRLRPNLDDVQRRHAIDLFRAAIADPGFHLSNGQRYTLTGVPVVVAGLAGAVQRSIFVLLGAALLVMAATLLGVFRSARRRARLVPLAIAVAAAAITYGLVSLLGFSLTMASIAALPVLIGLAVDYAIQLHARYDEERPQQRSPRAAAAAAARAGAPTIAGAALATAAGFLVLLLSPIPMVHGFALLVVLGIAIGFACALSAGLATLVLLARPSNRPPDLPPMLPRVRRRLAATRDTALARGRRLTDRGRLGHPAAAGTLIAAALVAFLVGATASALPLRLAMLAAILLAALALWVTRASRQALRRIARRRSRLALARAVDRPGQVLAIGAAIAVLGWVADTQTAVVSDVRQLVPQNLPALRDVNRLEAATGVSGEIDVTVRGDDLARPDVINWMTSFQQRVLARHGFTTGSTCLQRRRPPQLCPALSLTDLFRSPPTDEAQVRSLIDAIPPYFSQAVLSPDRRTAALAFGIRLMPLDRQKQVIDDIRNELHPPAGVSAEVAGLPVLAAEANGALASPGRRLLLLLAALAAVFLVLLVVRRRLARAAVPLIPIALATGWSALVLFLLRIPLNPMSAGLGALVVAISTEFSVLLSARYQEERDGGAGPERALEATYDSTGAAVLASAVTAIAGFGALVASDIRMLQDFGLVTLVDLSVSLAGVMLVLPAALVRAERGPLRMPDLRGRARIAIRRSALANLRLARRWSAGGLALRPRRGRGRA